MQKIANRFGDGTIVPGTCHIWRTLTKIAANGQVNRRLIVKVMKLTFLLLTVALLQVQASGRAQSVTLSGKDIPLTKVFSAIEQQTGYFVFGNADLLKSGRNVSVSVQNMPLRDFLDLVLKDQSFTYQVDDRTISLSRKPMATTPLKNWDDMLLPPPPLTGLVLDESRKPIPAVTVMSRKTYIIRITNDKGQFSFENLPDGDTLVLTSINYEPKIVAVSGSNMTVTMKASIKQLSGVTVLNTGFQTLSKERATGSFGKPDMEIFRKRTGTMDLIGRLEGQVAGLAVGMPGSVTSNENGNGVTTRKSLIRGASTINLSTEPLYVVNGVVIKEFSAINLDDVEDITVLKDAAAAAIWGSRATNGVIVITTKTGSKNQKLSVNYNGFINYTPRPDFSYGRTMSSKQFIQTAKEIFNPVAYPYSKIYSYAPHEQILYDQSRGVISAAEANRKLDSLASIDNLGQIERLFYRPGVTQNHTVSASGGTSLYSFYVSAGYTGIKGDPGSRNDQYRLSFSQSITANDRLKLTISASLVNAISSGKNYPHVSPGFLPYQLFQDANGNNIQMNYMTGYSDSVLRDYSARGRISLDYNPMDETQLAHADNNNLNYNVTTNVSVKLWKGLSFVGTYGYQGAPGLSSVYQDNKLFSQRYNILSYTVAPTVNSVPVYNVPVKGGLLFEGTNQQRNWTVRNQLAYDAVLRKGRDHITLQAGNDVQEGYMTQASSTQYGYNEQLGTAAAVDVARLSQGIFGTVTGYGFLSPSTYYVSKERTRYMSYFALGNYNLDGKYNLDLSVRQDYSSNFGRSLFKQNRPSWSMGVKWQVTKEKFMQSQKWLNDLGVRLTHGITGNSPVRTSAALDNIFSSVSSANNANAIGGDGLTLNGLANDALTWEKTHTTNLGIDYSILKRRLSGGIDVYLKNTTDLLGALQLNAWTGRSTTVGNIGKLVNKGIDLSLRSENIVTKDFSWSTSMVFGYNTNKLVSYSKSIDPSLVNAQYLVYGSLLKGYNSASLWAYRFAGLDNLGDPQIYLANKTKTKGGVTLKLEDIVYVGVTRPPVNGGMTNTFNYKGLSLSFNAIYSLGGVMRKAINTFYNGRMNVTAQNFSVVNKQISFLDRWKKPGDEAFTNIPSYVSDPFTSYTRRNMDFYTYADINIVSSSYVKLRDITLNYTVPVTVTKMIGVQSISVFGQTGNFLVWSAMGDRTDPEVPRTAGAARPRPGFSGGLNISF